MSYPFLDRGSPWNIIWESLDPLKVFSFVWEASQGRTLTCDYLQRGVKYLSTGASCAKAIWKPQTILLHCAIARNLWELALSCLGWCLILWDMCHWSGKGFSRRVKYKVFRAILHAIFWLLWMDINKRVSDGVDTSTERWLRALFFWKEEVFCSSSLM